MFGINVSGLSQWSVPRTGGGVTGRTGQFGSPLIPLSNYDPVKAAILSGMGSAGIHRNPHLKKRPDGDVSVSVDDLPDPAPSYSGPISPTAPSYLNADLASHYGMDAATAYQEALANTAHQREVNDLQAAGLNPVLSARYGGASGVSGARVLADSSSGSSFRSSDETDDISSLVGGMVSLFTGSSARGNAVEKIIHAAKNLFSPSSSKSLFDLF